MQTSSCLSCYKKEIPLGFKYCDDCHFVREKYGSLSDRMLFINKGGVISEKDINWPFKKENKLCSRHLWE